MKPSDHTGKCGDGPNCSSDEDPFSPQSFSECFQSKLLRTPLNVGYPRPLSDTFIHFRAYQLYSSNWPLSFRPRGFGAIYSLYIRALCLSSPLSLTPNQLNGASLRHSSSLLSVSKFSHQTTTKRAVPSLKFPTSVMNWYVETKRAAEEYQRVLGSVTRFPKAEETNSAINSFVDLCVAVWERGGCSETETGWVMEVCPRSL